MREREKKRGREESTLYRQGSKREECTHTCRFTKKERESEREAAYGKERIRRDKGLPYSCTHSQKPRSRNSRIDRMCLTVVSRKSFAGLFSFFPNQRIHHVLIFIVSCLCLNPLSLFVYHYLSFYFLLFFTPSPSVSPSPYGILPLG